MKGAENHMPGQEALIAISAVSRSRISPTMTMLGLDGAWPQGAKRSSHVRTHLHLIDPGYLVFNGILHGDDLRSGLLIAFKAE